MGVCTHAVSVERGKSGIATATLVGSAMRLTRPLMRHYVIWKLVYYLVAASQASSVRLDSWCFMMRWLGVRPNSSTIAM